MTKKKTQTTPAAVSEKPTTSVAADPVGDALSTLLEKASEWKKPTIGDIVDAHRDAIVALLAERCPIEKIASAMISGGVDAKPATLVRLIQGVKSGVGKKAPKKPAPKAKASPASAPVEVVPMSDSAPVCAEPSSITDVAGFLEGAISDA